MAGNGSERAGSGGGFSGRRKPKHKKRPPPTCSDRRRGVELSRGGSCHVVLLGESGRRGTVRFVCFFSSSRSSFTCTAVWVELTLQQEASAQQ